MLHSRFQNGSRFTFEGRHRMKTPLATKIFAAVAGLCICNLMPAPIGAADVYEIPVILTLTGSGAFAGTTEQTALQLAEKTVNASGGIGGRQLHFAIHDSQSSPQIAVQLTNAILAQKPAVFMGSSLTAECRAMLALIKDGPVMYCLSPGIHPDAGTYVFATGASSAFFAQAQINYYRSQGWKRIALIFGTDATGQDAEAGIKGVLALPENREMQVVDVQHFNPTDISVAAQLARIKAANPQVIIGWATGTPLGTIINGLKQANMDVPFGTSDGNMSYAEMEQYANILPRQLYMAASSWVVHNKPGFPMDGAVAKKQTDFYAAYQQAGMRPDNLSSLAWDPAFIIIDALRKLGPNATATQIHDYLANAKVPGVNGIHDYKKEPQRGLDLSALVVTLWSPSANTWQVISKPTGIADPLPAAR
jgi:branched-chain amino acid transport system substrate-binding protein